MIHQRFTHNLKERGLSLLCLLIVLMLGACQPKETDLPFETIERQEISGYQDKKPGLVIIAKQTEVTSLDALVTREILLRLQTLDYDTYLVVGVFQGWKPTTRYGVQIERVTRRGNIVTIHALFREPQPGEPKGDEVTSPYHLVQVQKAETWGQTITFNLVVGDAIVTSLSHYVP